VQDPGKEDPAKGEKMLKWEVREPKASLCDIPSIAFAISWREYAKVIVVSAKEVKSQILSGGIIPIREDTRFIVIIRYAFTHNKFMIHVLEVQHGDRVNVKEIARFRTKKDCARFALENFGFVPAI
jgi:ribosomal protein S17